MLGHPLLGFACESNGKKMHNQSDASAQLAQMRRCARVFVHGARGSYADQVFSLRPTCCMRRDVFPTADMEATLSKFVLLCWSCTLC